MDEDKKNIGLMDMLGGTAETALYIPQALGSVLLSALEGGVSKVTPESWGGGTFGEGFNRGLERYNYQPQTESGKASTDVVNKGMEYLDWPFQQFGEGIEEGATRLGASSEVSGFLGDAAYWGTSLLSPFPGGLTKGLLSVAKGRPGSKFGSGWGRGKLAIQQRLLIQRVKWLGKAYGNPCPQSKEIGIKNAECQGCPKRPYKIT